MTGGVSQLTEDQPAEVLLSVPRGRGPETAGFVAVDKGEETVAMRYDDLPGPWIFHVTGKSAGGQVVITSLGIEQRHPETPVSITQTGLRAAPIGVALDRVKRALRVAFENRVSHLLGDVRTHQPKQGRSRPAAHYMQVAWYYTYAVSTGRAPRKVVADHWKVSLVTASRWIAEARRRDYLAEYQSGIRLGRVVEYPRPAQELTEDETNRYRERHTDAELELHREEHLGKERERFSAEHSDASHHMRAATSETEQRIFLKVLRAQVLHAFDQAETGQGHKAVADLLTNIAGWTIDEITGGAQGAGGLRSTVFIDELFRLAEQWPHDEGRNAAAALLAALRQEKQQNATSAHTESG